MMEIQNMARFDGKYVTTEDGTEYIRIEYYGGFYEWCKKLDKTYLMVEVTDSKKLEESFDKYKSSNNRNVVNI